MIKKEITLSKTNKFQNYVVNNAKLLFYNNERNLYTNDIDSCSFFNKYLPPEEDYRRLICN